MLSIFLILLLKSSENKLYQPSPHFILTVIVLKKGKKLYFIYIYWSGEFREWKKMSRVQSRNSSKKNATRNLPTRQHDVVDASTCIQIDLSFQFQFRDKFSVSVLHSSTPNLSLENPSLSIKILPRKHKIHQHS